MLKWRVLSALVGLPLLVAALWLGGLPLLLVVLLLTWLAGWEWWRLAGGTRLGPATPYTKAVFFVGLTAIVLTGNLPAAGGAGSAGPLPGPAGAALAAGSGFLLYALLWTGAALQPAGNRRKPGAVGNPLPAGGLLLSGWFYVGFPFAHWPALRALGDSLPQVGWPPGTLLWVVMVVWAGDTAAYFIGSRWGRRPLAPALSPNKSVEGALAGLAASVTVAFLLRLWPGWSGFAAVLAGLLAALAGQLGDLWESALKRGAGIKDSSGLIPGHGGVLDRFDGLLLAVPATYYLLLWLPN